MMKAALMLGVNPNAEREVNDFYATHPSAIITALPKLKEYGLNNNVWECACGIGSISEVLKNNGYNVYSSDLIDRGYGEVKDFLKCQDKFNGDIITNPPFKYAVEFVEKSMELLEDGNKAFFFLKIQFAESQERKELFEKYPIKAVLAYSKRQRCCKDAEFDKYKSATQFYAWFIFEKGYKGKTILDWI